MKQSKKMRHLVRTIHHSKPLVAALSLLLSLLLVIGSTYSWLTYSDEKINKSKANTRELSAIIEETFEPEYLWAPGITVEKNVWVKNNGQMPAIVRLSLFEYYLTFQTDVTDRTGNGNLITQSSPSATEILRYDTKTVTWEDTWQPNNTLKVGTKTYWMADKVSKPNQAHSSEAYHYGGTRSDVLAYITPQFKSGVVYTTVPGSSKKNYWFYEDGYFYYSEVVQPGETTEILVEKVTASQQLPNRYKGLLYHLVPVMDAHDIGKSLETDWGLSGNVKAMYAGKLQ